MEIVLSGDYKLDDYGNFRFTDKGGTEHKIGTKRENFDELCSLVEHNPGRAVKLTYDTYKNRKYIVGIELLEITVDEKVITEQQKVKPAPAPQELGMWWKELGECIRSGAIDKDFPNSNVLIKGQYYKQMESVTGISMKKEE